MASLEDGCHSPPLLTLGSATPPLLEAPSHTPPGEDPAGEDPPGEDPAGEDPAISWHFLGRPALGCVLTPEAPRGRGWA